MTMWRDRLLELLETEKVRLYTIAQALVTLAAFYLPSDAWPLVLGVVAAVVGVGEKVVRANVTPEVRAADRELRAFNRGIVASLARVTRSKRV